MLFDLEPHPDVTGDLWYNAQGQEIDEAFIRILTEQCYNFIRNKVQLLTRHFLDTQGWASTEEICSYIRKSGVSKIELRVENIQSIVDTLIYDRLIETVDDPTRARAFLVSVVTLQLTLLREPKRCYINQLTSHSYPTVSLLLHVEYVQCSIYAPMREKSLL